MPSCSDILEKPTSSLFPSRLLYIFNHTMKSFPCSLVLLFMSIALARASSPRRQSSSARHMSFHSNDKNPFQQRLTDSQELAMLEQDVEDYNAQWVATAPDAIAAISKTTTHLFATG